MQGKAPAPKLAVSAPGSALSSRRSRAIFASKVRLHPVASTISRQLRQSLSSGRDCGVAGFISGAASMKPGRLRLGGALGLAATPILIVLASHAKRLRGSNGEMNKRPDLGGGWGGLSGRF